AAAPSRPRLFGLDALSCTARPRLAGWVSRAQDIRAAGAAAAEALGRIEAMSGNALERLISIAQDGSLPRRGVAPSLVQWRTATHPASSMPDAGCGLIALDLLHPEPRRIDDLLRSIGLSEPGVELSVNQAPEPRLMAHIRTPQGRRTLGTTHV